MKTTTTGKFWWTVLGKRADKTATLMKHDTRSSAELHYGLARSLGGDFDYLALTKREATGAEALELLEAAGWKVAEVLGGYAGWSKLKVKGAAA